MKWKSFLAGVLTTLLIMALAIPALAASDFPSSIDIAPINILVNGEVFRPKDVNGNDVLVFVSNGTTYAPLRALAEAYGLVVGYDAETYTATVTAPTPTPAPTPVPTEAPAFDADYSKWTAEQETGYQEFKAMWTQFPSTHEWFSYNGTLTEPELKAHLNSIGQETIMAYGKRWITESWVDATRIYEIVLCYDDSCASSLDPSDWKNAILVDLEYSNNQWYTTDFKLD